MNLKAQLKMVTILQHFKSKHSSSKGKWAWVDEVLIRGAPYP
jgi:hypothetical protein